MTSQDEKVGTIIDYFSFTNLDDATLRLKEVLRHCIQEGKRTKDVDKYLLENTEKIVDEVYSRLFNDKGDYRNKIFYKKPLATCEHFSYLLKEIGRLSGKNCEIVACNPEFLNGLGHTLVHNVSDDKYLDPTIYRTYYDVEKKKWIKTPPLFMITIPPEQVNCK